MDTLTPSPNRVAIMMNTLVQGRMGGTEVFADELMPRLHNLRSRNTYVDVMADGEMLVSVENESVYLPTAAAGTGGIARLKNLIFNTIRGGQLRKIVGQHDVAFYPFSAVTPRLKPNHGTVVTIHDLQHRDLPELFTLGQRIYRYLTYERPAKRAQIVTVVSDFSAHSVHTKLGIPHEKIRRIYPGIDHEFFSPRRENQYTSQSRFIYYPARGLKHKNHRALFAAMAIVRETIPELELVLTGADGDRINDIPHFVRHEGHVSRVRVRELYQSASAVVFPSLYEGFGFPPLEAMASGCPVICSNSGSLEEICGGAALMVNATNPESISNGILEVLQSPVEWSRKGILRASSFSWDKCAVEYDQLFNEVVIQSAHQG